MKPRLTKCNSQFQNSLAVICGALLMICAGQPGFGQQDGLKQAAGAVGATPVKAAFIKPAAVQQRRKNETPASASQGSGGIRIHGYWKFVVRNADGTLASTKEFENALITPQYGDFVLGGALLGQTVIVDWAVLLCPQPATPGGAFRTAGSPCPQSQYPIAFLVTSLTGPIGSLISSDPGCCVAGLTATVNNTGPAGAGPVSVSLSGSYTATQPVTINAVGTYSGYCTLLGGGPGFLNISPATCDTLSASKLATGNATVGVTSFTGTNQTQVLNAGQSLSITVTFTFS
jgi:hypothetical protein